MTKQFTELLKLAMEAENRCREYDKPHRLSVEAFTLEALSFANTNPAKVKKLKEALEADREKFEKSWAFLRHAIRQLREGTIKSTQGMKPLHLRWLAMGDNEGVSLELGPMASNPFELFALAVMVTAEKHPDAFGDIKNWKTHQQKLRDSQSLRGKLFEEIAKSYTSEDLLIGDVESNGMAQITFSVSGGAVPLAPINNAGERLINHLLENLEIMKVEEPAIRRSRRKETVIMKDVKK